MMDASGAPPSRDDTSGVVTDPLKKVDDPEDPNDKCHGRTDCVPGGSGGSDTTECTPCISGGFQYCQTGSGPIFTPRCEPKRGEQVPITCEPENHCAFLFVMECGLKGNYSN